MKSEADILKYLPWIGVVIALVFGAAYKVALAYGIPHEREAIREVSRGTSTAVSAVKCPAKTSSVSAVCRG